MPRIGVSSLGAALVAAFATVSGPTAAQADGTTQQFFTVEIKEGRVARPRAPGANTMTLDDTAGGETPNAAPGPRAGVLDDLPASPKARFNGVATRFSQGQRDHDADRNQTIKGSTIKINGKPPAADGLLPPPAQPIPGSVGQNQTISVGGAQSESALRRSASLQARRSK
jgi:hypothetical protein